MMKNKSNYHKELDWVAKILSFYGNCEIKNIKSRFSEEILLSLGNNLRSHPIPFKERIPRKLIDPILQKLSSKYRLKITSLLKRIRNPNMNIKIKYPRDFLFNLLLSDLRKESEFSWNGYQCVVCITHDVDNLIGYDYLSNIISINQKFKLVSTINFVTHYDYKVEAHLLSELYKRGYEIGLHGYIHDIGLAYRSTQTIRSRLNSALKAIKIPVLGFRGPALCSSSRLFSVLVDLGIRYDSSFQALSPFYHSSGLTFPYPLLEHKLWELPLTIQDDNFFRDCRLSNSEALKILKRILTEIHHMGGMAILNFHPHIIKVRPYFYEAALDLIMSLDDIWVTTTGNIYDYVSSNYRKHLDRANLEKV